MATDRAKRPVPENRLLAQLPKDERERLGNELEPVELTLGKVLYEVDQPIDHAWFPKTGVASLVSPMEDGRIVEIATVGPEGFVGLPILFEAGRAPNRCFIQIPGEGWRIAAPKLKSLFDVSPEFRKLALRYAQALFNQMAQNAACNRLHSIEERAARWILMTQDRVNGSKSFPLTQEFLAQMLGVRRPSVSVAASMLQKAELITYSRGSISITDRAGLEEATCECYGVIRREFERLVGVPG